MPVFVISHPSLLTAYIIAVILHHHFSGRVRLLRIMVVENAAGGLRNLTNHSVHPWCGTNTFTNLHLQHSQNAVQNLLRQFLAHHHACRVFPVGSLRFSGPIPSPSPDSPVSDHVSMRISHQAAIALVYHPVLLTNYLRQQVQTLAGISIVSLAPGHELADAFNGCTIFDYRVQTSPLLYPHTLVSYEGNVPNNPPRSIVWLPKLGGGPLQIQHFSGRTTVILQPLRPTADIDLMHGLRVADYTVGVATEAVVRRPRL